MRLSWGSVRRDRRAWEAAGSSSGILKGWTDADREAEVGRCGLCSDLWRGRVSAWIITRTPLVPGLGVQGPHFPGRRRTSQTTCLTRTHPGLGLGGTCELISGERVSNMERSWDGLSVLEAGAPMLGARGLLSRSALGRGRDRSPRPPHSHRAGRTGACAHLRGEKSPPSLAASQNQGTQKLSKRKARKSEEVYRGLHETMTERDGPPP